MLYENHEHVGRLIDHWDDLCGDLVGIEFCADVGLEASVRRTTNISVGSATLPQADTILAEAHRKMRLVVLKELIKFKIYEIPNAEDLREYLETYEQSHLKGSLSVMRAAD